VTDLLREGLIQRFEYTHELAWNVMKDYAEYQGNTEIRGSRDAIRWALQNGLADDKAWMKSIEDRNLSSHDYDRPTADAIFSKVIGTYLPLFNRFEQTMVSISKEEM
jgi:nucleotidyltransferase substrate binding protein (TIGR01987 family)